MPGKKKVIVKEKQINKVSTEDELLNDILNSLSKPNWWKSWC
jgi:hypothetical protein